MLLCKVSIIVPIYNQEAFLYKCLKSIQDQTYKNIEVLLIDDGSTDNSGKICDLFSEQDDRFIVFHINNSGVAAARNIGLDNANGDLIGFVDPDDWIHSKMYEVLTNLYHRFLADIIQCGRIEVFDDNSTVTFNSNFDIKVCDREEALSLLTMNDQIKSHLWSSIYKKSLFNNLRFEVNRVYEDVWILHQLFGRANTFVFSNNKLYYYRQHPHSIVRSLSLKNQIDYCYALKCRYEYLKNEYNQYNDNVIKCLHYEVLNLVDIIAKSEIQLVYKYYEEILDILVFYNKITDLKETTKEKLLNFNIFFTLLIYRIKYKFKGE